jgi:hypothetical protein
MNHPACIELDGQSPVTHRCGLDVPYVATPSADGHWVYVLCRACKQTYRYLPTQWAEEERSRMASAAPKMPRSDMEE